MIRLQLPDLPCGFRPTSVNRLTMENRAGRIMNRSVRIEGYRLCHSYINYDKCDLFLLYGSVR